MFYMTNSSLNNLVIFFTVLLICLSFYTPSNTKNIDVFRGMELYNKNCASCHMGNLAGNPCLLYTSPSPRDVEESRMPSSA